MSSVVDRGTKFLGLLELDAAGTVLYFRPENDSGAESSNRNITGQNFYTEVAPFENVEELQQCLDNFIRGSQQVSSIHFTCRYQDGPLQVRVLLARIRERSEQQKTKSILVHIRSAQP